MAARDIAASMHARRDERHGGWRPTARRKDLRADAPLAYGGHRQGNGAPMPQIFRPSINALARASLVGVVVGLAVTIWLLYALFSSSYEIGRASCRERV